MKMMMTSLTFGLLSLGAQASVETFDAGQATNWQSANNQRASVVTHPSDRANHVYHLQGQGAVTVWNLPEPKDIYQVSFLLERWTSSGDFSLKVEGFDGENWVTFTPELNKKFGTGGLRKVTANSNGAFDAERPTFSKIRFTANTPENKGALIDNVEVLEFTPMAFIGADTPETATTPILRGFPVPKAITYPVKFSGALPNIALTKLKLSAVNAHEIAAFRVMANDQLLTTIEYNVPKPKKPGFFKRLFSRSTANDPVEATFDLALTIPTGTETIGLVPVAKKDATIGEKVTVTVEEITLVNETTKEAHQLGAAESIAMRISEEVGYNNYEHDGVKISGFRIPGMITSKKGTLIAAYDIRYNHHGDLPANIEVGVSRSTDGGQSWEPMIIAMHKDIEGLGHGVGDPAILVDDVTGRIWMAVLGAPKTGHPIWSSVAGSTSPANVGQYLLAYSDDDGITWSEPINITESIKRLGDEDTKLWGCLFQGPGNGFTMRDGTLVFPSQVWTKKEDGKAGSSLGVLVYSKDQGKTWQSSKATTYNNIHASESQAAELSDGTIMFNARNEQRNGRRLIATTNDLGETWNAHPTDRNKETGLRESTCQASFWRVSFEPNILAFCNPDTTRGRHSMTIKLSYDDGMTWTNGLLINEAHCYGYSAMTMIDEETLGVIYESRGGLIFESIKLQEIIDAN